MEFTFIWSHYLYPLARLIFFISLGVFIGNLIEALNWTKWLASLSKPLVKFGHLQPISGASFSVAFFSGVSANTMLAEAYDQNQISRKELILSNLFNSLPTYFLHLPTTFFLVAPFIKQATIPYFSLTIGAALFRTLFTIGLGHFILPPPKDTQDVQNQIQDSKKEISYRELIQKTVARFQKRLKKILVLTVPIYIGFKLLAAYGFFHWLEKKVAGLIVFFPWIPTKAISVIIMQMAADFSAGLAAASALLDSHALTVKQIVIALILGNILSSPLRALRHQFPYYAGIYPPKLAVLLMACNQGLRIISLALMLFLYCYCF